VSEGSNVFLRWARLKQKTQTARAPVAPGEAGAGAAQAGTNAADSEPFDPASLPSIDSIVADTDIVGYLQSGVPAELTRAALRQAWLTDPAIRDFIGVADNQWDFNDPNGISGFGPLGTMQGQVGFLSQVSPSLLKMPDLLAEEMSPVMRDSKVVQSEQSEAAQHAHRGSSELHSTGVSSRDICETHAAAENEDAVGQYDASFSRWRHGSALPR
jgi:hypothetical protein